MKKSKTSKKNKETISLNSIWKEYILIPYLALKEGNKLVWKKERSKFFFFITCVLSFLYISILSQNTGISSDEYRYIRQAKKNIEYYKTLGKDKSAITQKGIDPQHYNGQSLDNFMCFVQSIFKFENEFKMRHLIVSWVAWLSILFAALLGIKLYNFHSGSLVIFTLLFTPRYFGHCLNNHRDIPVALAIVASMYFFLNIVKRIYNPNKFDLIGLTLALGFGMSIRLMSFVLSVGIIGVLALMHILLVGIKKKAFKKNPTKRITKYVKYLGLPVVGGLLIGILSWPFALESPLKNIMEVFNASTSLQVSLKQLFDGHQIMSNEIPWYYTLKYILITTPVAILLLLLLSVIVAPFTLSKKNFFEFLSILFVLAFPLAYGAYKVSNDYGGLRHFIFVLPFMVILAIYGYQILFNSRLLKRIKDWNWLILAILLLNPILFSFKNHLPYNYLYFNETVGGLNKMFYKYDSDYAYQSLKEGAAFLSDYLKENRTEGDTLVIASNDRRIAQHYLRNVPDVKIIYTRYYNRFRVDWDYAVFACSYISPFELGNGGWPGFDQIHIMEADQVPVGYVAKRKGDKKELVGINNLDKGNYKEARIILEEYLTENPLNSEVWAELGVTYMSLQDRERSLKAFDKALSLRPDNLSAISRKSSLLLDYGEINEAFELIDKGLSYSSNQYYLYYLKAVGQLRLEQFIPCIDNAIKAIQLNPKHAQSYDIAINAYTKMGNNKGVAHMNKLKSQYLK